MAAVVVVLTGLPLLPALIILRRPLLSLRGPVANNREPVVEAVEVLLEPVVQRPLPAAVVEGELPVAQANSFPSLPGFLSLGRKVIREHLPVVSAQRLLNIRGVLRYVLLFSVY